MRVVALAILFSLLAGCGMAAKLNRLEPHERDHHAALRVWMNDAQQREWLRLRTEDERNAWLQQRGLWERFYEHDERTRRQILAGEVERGWTSEMVLMAWGTPHSRQRLTGRPAVRSELYVFRFEVDREGLVYVWTQGSKVTHRAVARYQLDVILDDNKVTEINRKERWE